MRSEQPESQTQTSLVFAPESYLYPLSWSTVFPEQRPLEMELGSGDGGFLFQWASTHAERQFVGVERLLGRLRKLDRKARRAGLRNLKLLRIEAGYLLRYLVPPATLSALHLYFPDPWPKKRHQKNRLFQEPFVHSVARVLIQGGCLYVRTDNQPYYDQILAVMAGFESFCQVDTPAELKCVLTDFERDFHAQGIATRHAAWQRL